MYVSHSIVSHTLLITQYCLTVCDPMDYSLLGSPVHGIFQARQEYSDWIENGMDSHFLLQEIFLTQRSNLGLLHCRQILYHLSHQGSPKLTLPQFKIKNNKTEWMLFILSLQTSFGHSVPLEWG